MTEPDGGGLDIEISGVTALDWVTARIDDTEIWDDLVDEGLQ